MDSEIAVTAAIKQQIITYPLFRAYFLFFWIISCVIQKYFEQETLILFDFLQMDRFLRIKTNCGNILVLIYPIYLYKNSIFTTN